MELMVCMELFIMMAQGKGYKPVMFYDDGVAHAMEARMTTSEGTEYAQFIASIEEDAYLNFRLKGFKKMDSTCNIQGKEIPVFAKLATSLKA
jgi:hypothetical protein